MDNKMEDYYKVLQWLRETHIDRQYPYEFDETDNIEHSEDVELVEDHHSDFDNSLHIQNIQADSRFVFTCQELGIIMILIILKYYSIQRKQLLHQT